MSVKCISTDDINWSSPSFEAGPYWKKWELKLKRDVNHIRSQSRKVLASLVMLEKREMHEPSVKTQTKKPVILPQITRHRWHGSHPASWTFLPFFLQQGWVLNINIAPSSFSLIQNFENLDIASILYGIEVMRSPLHAITKNKKKILWPTSNSCWELN
jgi:hypothetical protein